jgi:lipooligosaccharide transport system permease protein
MAIIAGGLRVVEHNALVFRRIWRGSIVVSFFMPLFFLASIGIGLGGLVNRGSGGVGGVPYVDFLAPGLLAATTMQTAAFECMYPILGKIMWDRIYDAMLATPMAVRDLLAGEVAWIALRLLMVSSIFWVVMAAFGVARTPESLLAIPVSTLNGLAFATPIIAYTATKRNDSGFAAITRFGIMPMFLFAGAFFPIARLPGVLQALAWLTPLAHGVALSRALVLGNVVAGDAVLHLTVLAAYTVGGIIVARALLIRRLVK